MADEQIDVKIVADASSVKPQTDQVKDAIAAVGAAATGTQKGVASLSAEVRQAAGDAMTLRQSASNVTPALQGTSGSADQTKSAMTSLMSELSGVASSFADGVNPMTIFAQHGLQIVAAIAGMTKGGAGLARFLGGPWGIAIMGAAEIIGTTLIPKLLEGQHEAENLAAKISQAAGNADSFGTAQNNLAKVVELTSGKLDKHNIVLFEYIKLQAQANLLAAQQKEIVDSKTVRGFGKQSIMDRINAAASISGDEMGTGVGQDIAASIAEKSKVLSSIVGQLHTSLSQIVVTGTKSDGDLSLQASKVNGAIQAATAQVEALGSKGKITRERMLEVKQAILDLGTDKNNQIAAAMSIGILNGSPVPKEMKPRPTEHPKSPVSRIDQWDAELDRQRTAIKAKADAEGNFREMSQQQEADYWGRILQRSDLSNAERLGIEKKYFDLRGDIRKKDFDAHVAALTKELDAAQGNGAERLRIATQIAAETKAKYGEESDAYKAAQERIVQITKETAEQRRQIEAQTAEASRQRQLDDVAREEATAKFQVELGVKTNDQLLADQAGFEERRHRLQMAPLYGDRDRAKEDGKDLVRIGALNNQIEAAEQQHQQKMTAIQRQRTLERTQIERQAIAATASLWGQNIARLATLQQGFGATLRSIYSGMVGIVSDALGQMLQKWIKAELSKTAATLTGSGQRTAAEVTAGTTTTGISALSAIKQIAHSAAVAAARVYASIAQIPIVGPVLAPAAAAAALYGVIKLGQSIFSARDGIGTVPYDDAPFLLHRNEMVLPANLASPLRAMLQGGSAANGNAPFAANDGGGHSFHYNDYTEKGQSDAQIMAKRMVFAKAVRQAYREGAFAGTPIAF